MKKEALDYHAQKKGKITTCLKTKTDTQADLSLAYSPGVAYPCQEIAKNPELIDLYTNHSNLVAVITNGTAVLGLGDIGPLASKPVMEGKAVLFKKFADVDAVDLLIDSKDPNEVIKTVELVALTYGGINLEDIKAPECFRIEQELKSKLDIPVFHDDQHGTAVVSGAGLLNALEITNKKIEEIKVVLSGAGAAGLSCAQFYLDLGVKPENLVICDRQGAIYEGRENLNEYKKEFATKTKVRTLKEAMVGADVLLGVSAKGLVDAEMIKSMDPNPILFALANPDSEIDYGLAKKTRSDLIIATGRSDYPNQINNVLGFPFIFRGALDVGAKEINEEMKKSAAKALAQIAKLPVPKDVLKAYNLTKLEFGPEYIIPKPFDKRVAVQVSLAVARAAVKSEVARVKNFDSDKYQQELEKKFL